jgi:hypothetical protein
LGGPTAGLVVGLEQGGGLLSTAFGQASDTTKAAIIGGAGALTGLGAAWGISSLLNPTEGAVSTSGGMLDTIKETITGKDDTSTGNQGVATPQGAAGTIENAGVVTPQTQVLTKTATGKRKKTRLQPRTANISQRVNIVMSQSQNKRYINKFVQSR